jgi:hypothetical protein
LTLLSREVEMKRSLLALLLSAAIGPHLRM